MMWIVILTALICGIIWIKCAINHQTAQEKETRTKVNTDRSQKRRNAYAELEKIWPYGDRSALGIYSGCNDNLALCYVSIQYEVYSNSWKICVIKPVGPLVCSSTYEAKLQDSMLISTNGEELVVLKNASLQIGKTIVCLDPNDERLNSVQELLDKYLDNQPRKAIKKSHFESATDSSILSALPRFTFTCSPDGVKCDEINFAEKKLKAWFDNRAGSPYIQENEVYYRDYCKNGDLPMFGIDEYQCNNYMKSIRATAISMGLVKMNTDYDNASWDVGVRHGVNQLFRLFKQYVSNRTLDYVPAYVNLKYNMIYLYPRERKFKTNDYSAKNLACASANQDIIQRYEENGDKNNVVDMITIGSINDQYVLLLVEGEEFVIKLNHRES